MKISIDYEEAKRLHNTLEQIALESAAPSLRENNIRKLMFILTTANVLIIEDK